MSERDITNRLRRAVKGVSPLPRTWDHFRLKLGHKFRK